MSEVLLYLAFLISELTLYLGEGKYDGWHQVWQRVHRLCAKKKTFFRTCRLDPILPYRGMVRRV